MAAARVVRLVGGGTDALRQAIESGVMSVEAKRIAEQVLRENSDLRRKLRACEGENRELRTLNRMYRDMEMTTIQQAVEAQEVGQGLHDWRAVLHVVLFAAGVYLAMLATCAAVLRW